MTDAAGAGGLVGSEDAAADGDLVGPEPRQRIVRSRSGRRAKLTPAPGTSAEPVPADEPVKDAPPASDGTRGPNDEQLRRDVPPHY